MKRHRRGQLLTKALCICFACILLLTPLQVLAQEEYSDLAGHWAEDTCRQAVEDGIIVGYDGQIRPDASITLAEILTILDRVVGSKLDGDLSPYNISDVAWYRDAVSHSEALKLLSVLDGEPAFTQALPRSDVFLLLAEAFQLMNTEPDISCLSAFKDADRLTNENRGATAVLVNLGIVVGADNALLPDQPVTRAEFLTLLYRVISEFVDADGLSGDLKGNVLIAPTVCPAQDEESEEEGEENVDPLPSDGVEPSPDQDETPETDDDTEEATEDNLDAEDDPSSLEGEEEDLDAPISETPVEEDENGEKEPDVPVLPVPEEAGNWAVVNGLETEHNLLFDAGCSNFQFENARLTGNVLIRSDEIESFTLEGAVEISRLTVAAQSGEVTVAPQGDQQIDTVHIGTGSDEVTLSGNISHVEVTGNNRVVVLRGINLESLKVSGSNNRIIVHAGATVQSLKTVNSGAQNSVVINGLVENLLAAGTQTWIAGDGKVTDLHVTGPGSIANIERDSYEEVFDRGIGDVTIRFDAPSVVKAGGTLAVTANFENVSGEMICSVQWYRNGTPVAAYKNDAFAMTEGKQSTYRPEIVFSKNMETTITIGLSVTYVAGTKIETRWEEITVPIENYSIVHYYGADADRVLAMVKPYYSGSTSKNDNKDYATYDKEVFVNVKGYSSSSKYLVWVSLDCQKINIFEGSKENWTLIRSGAVATGKASTPTPVGVFAVTRKQSGWYTSSYTVKPVVRFSAGAGYAFHSRKYYPGTNRLMDDRIGFPVSLGCVRMYDADIQWMYDYLPIGSTVVVY